MAKKRTSKFYYTTMSGEIKYTGDISQNMATKLYLQSYFQKSFRRNHCIASYERYDFAYFLLESKIFNLLYEMSTIDWPKLNKQENLFVLHFYLKPQFSRLKKTSFSESPAFLLTVSYKHCQFNLQNASFVLTALLITKYQQS